LSATLTPTPTKAVIERPIPNYRQLLKKALPAEYFKPDYTHALWYLVHAGIIGASYYALTYHFSYWLAPILALVIGHSFGCMGFVAHDIAHGGAYKRLWLRDLLAGIGFSPLWIGPLLWRKWHNGEHHTNTQVKGLDPDHLFTMEDYEKNPVLQFLYRINPLLRNLIIFSSFTYRMTQQSIRMLIAHLGFRENPWHEKLAMLLQFFGPMAAWTALTLSLGTQVFWWGYVIPLFITNAIVISYIATNHFLNELNDERDVLATSLSVTLPRGLKWLDPWHSYFGAHVAHHLFPQAAAKHTRKIEEKVAEMFPDRYHCMPITTALSLLWKTPWVYENDQVLIDPNRKHKWWTLGTKRKVGLKDEQE
jgi:fatty acid desaturase